MLRTIVNFIFCVFVFQVLNRLTFASTLSHLRRLNSPIGRDGKLARPRQIHITQWGMICPAETPEVSNIYRYPLTLETLPSGVDCTASVQTGIHWILWLFLIHSHVFEMPNFLIKGYGWKIIIKLKLSHINYSCANCEFKCENKEKILYCKIHVYIARNRNRKSDWINILFWYLISRSCFVFYYVHAWSLYFGRAVLWVWWRTWPWWPTSLWDPSPPPSWSFWRSGAWKTWRRWLPLLYRSKIY